MRLHRFYVNTIVGKANEIVIDNEEQINQIRKVFRLKTGDSLIVFDGSGSDYECRIEERGASGRNSLTLAVQSVSRSHYMPERRLVLCAALTKKDTFEWIVEKATELGVTDIVPVLAERSEKKSLNMARLNKIAVEASEQSGRGCVPKIAAICGLGETLNLCDLKLLAMHTEGEVLKLNAGDAVGADDSIASLRNSPLAVFIGPEGGWSPTEIDMFHKAGVAIYSLGNQVLRAETAVVAALSLLALGK